MDRLTKKSLEAFSPEQKELYESLTKTRAPVQEGHVGGPFDGWLLNAELGRRAVGLGNMFRFRTNVDRRYVEIVILVTGQFWQAQFEWYAHEHMAIEAGVPQAVVDSIKIASEPVSDDERDVVAWRLAHELHTNHRVSDATYADAVRLFDEVGVAELVNLAGYYTMVSMTLNTFDVSLPEGATYPFPNN